MFFILVLYMDERYVLHRLFGLVLWDYYFSYGFCTFLFYKNRCDVELVVKITVMFVLFRHQQLRIFLYGNISFSALVILLILWSGSRQKGNDSLVVVFFQKIYTCWKWGILVRSGFLPHIYIFALKITIPKRELIFRNVYFWQVKKLSFYGFPAKRELF